MKAAVCHAYGPPEVVTIEDVPAPVVGDRDVLIRVRATTVNSGDWRLRSGIAPRGFGLLIRLAMGITRPRNPVLGTELSGDVESVGRAVKQFAVGDRVFANVGANLGAHAEFIAVSEDAAVTTIPGKLTFEQAAALSFGGTTALYFLRDRARIKRGERVLVNGASGSVGSAAVQLAKHFGAEVTGVCSAANASLVRSLGATTVLDYAVEDFRSGKASYDVIFDAVGNCSFANCKDALAAGGRLLLVVGTLGQLVGANIRPLRSGKLVMAGVTPEKREDLEFLKGLAESGAFTPVVGKTLPFERIVEAYALVDSGHKTGSVVLTI